MNDCSDDCDLAAICSARHWSIYWIIIVCSVLFVCGRIMTLGLVTPKGTTPMFSANDRSRWATIRSLGDQGTYEIDGVISDRSSGIHWDTIDKVQHLGDDGRLHFYSSKPTLLPTILAGLYRSVSFATGWNLRDDPIPIVRTMLLIFNAGSWLLMMWLLGKLLECVAVRDWTRYFIVAVAGFGTFLSTFAISLNNHLPAAVCIMAVLYGLVRIVNFGRTDTRLFGMTGLAAAFAAANELPALLMLVAAGMVCAFKSPIKFAIGFLPMALVVAAAFFGTNWLAHHDWRPPYAHRDDGVLVDQFTGQFRGQLESGQLPNEFAGQVESLGITAPTVEPARWPFLNEDNVERWVVIGIDGHRATIVAKQGEQDFRLHRWDNWYDYPGSYWLTNNERKSTIDRGESDTATYLFHVLFGHHGIFSLTPIWLLSFAGAWAMLFTKNLNLRWLAAMTILISLVVIAFYVFRVPDHDRNYGGRTSAFRWAFWLAPMWLVCLCPVVDWLGRSKAGRSVCLLLLALSAFSAMYSMQNPWVHPWLYQWLNGSIEF